jgi:hypothetical protein
MNDEATTERQIWHPALRHLPGTMGVEPAIFVFHSFAHCLVATTALPPLSGICIAVKGIAHYPPSSSDVEWTT